MSRTDAQIGNIQQEESPDGYLMVGTPKLRVDQDGNPVERSDEAAWKASSNIPSGYAIYDAEGRRLYEVSNYSPFLPSEAGPSVVALPPGHYLIVLDHPAGEARAFWVKVKAGLLSEVDATRLGQVEIRNSRAES